MDEEEIFKEYSRFCVTTRKKNIFKKVKAKINKSQKGIISVSIQCSGFDTENEAKMFAGIIEDLMSSREGYGIDYNQWAYKKDEDKEKIFQIVPIKYWEKNHDITDYARDFVEFPSDIGFSYINGSTIEYDGTHAEALDILKNLGFKKI